MGVHVANVCNDACPVVIFHGRQSGHTIIWYLLVFLTRFFHSVITMKMGIQIFILTHLLQLLALYFLKQPNFLMICGVGFCRVQNVLA